MTAHVVSSFGAHLRDTTGWGPNRAAAGRRRGRRSRFSPRRHGAEIRGSRTEAATLRSAREADASLLDAARRRSISVRQRLLAPRVARRSGAERRGSQTRRKFTRACDSRRSTPLLRRPMAGAQAVRCATASVRLRVLRVSVVETVNSVDSEAEGAVASFAFAY
jgi:hypothetical protein